MKILFKQHRYHSNVIEWFRAFQRQGHQVNLILYKPDETKIEGLNPAIYLPPAKRSERLRKKNPRTRGDGIDRFSPYYFPAFTTLIQFLKKEKPDLVVLRPAFTLFSYMFLLLKPFFGYKVLFYSQVRIAKHVAWYKKVALHTLLRLFNAHWISPCPGQPKKFRALSQRMVYFPFTIRPKLSQRKDYMNNGQIHILVVAKMYSSKNILLVLELIKRLRTSYDHLRLNIVSGGEIHQPYHKKVLNYIAEHQLSDRVHLHYGKPREEMEQFYLSHDLFILPSNYDQAAYVPVESMAHGLVTIASTGNGTSDYLTHGVDGFIFPKNDLAALEGIVVKLIENTDLISKMGNQAIVTIRKNHDPDTCVQRLLKAINSKP